MAPSRRVSISKVGAPAAGLCLCLLAALGLPGIDVLCDSGGAGRCAIETKSLDLIGLPVALWGVVGFAALILAMIGLREVSPWIASLMLGVAVYAQRTMIIEWGSFCLLCGVITLLTLATWLQALKGRGGRTAVLGVAVAVFAGVFLLLTEDSVVLGADLDREGLSTYRGQFTGERRIDFFGSFSCESCRAQERLIDGIIESHPDVLVVYRDLSLTMEPDDGRFAHACAAVALFQGPQAYESLRRAAMADGASLSEVLARHPMPQMSRRMRERTRQKVLDDARIADSFRVTVTPLLIISSRDRVVSVLKGLTSRADLLAALDAPQ